MQLHSPCHLHIVKIICVLKRMRLRLVPFTLSFCIGLCVMMLFAPKPRVVIKFPRPDTSEHIYKAADGSCFRVKSRKVTCEQEAGVTVLPQPVHELRDAVPHDEDSHHEGAISKFLSSVFSKR